MMEKVQPWYREEGTNIDKYISADDECDKEAWRTWYDQTVFFQVRVGNTDDFTRLILDENLHCVKALVYREDRNIQVLNPCGAVLQSILKGVTKHDYETGFPEGPYGEPRTIKCGLCDATAEMRPFTEKDEDWINDGNGVDYIGWTPWVRHGDEEINVCPKCTHRIEIGPDDLAEVM